MAKHKRKNIVRRVAHAVWVQMVESGAIRTGETVQLDPRWTGDRFSPSPAVREVIREDYTESTTTEVHESRKVKS